MAGFTDLALQRKASEHLYFLGIISFANLKDMSQFEQKVAGQW